MRHPGIERRKNLKDEMQGFAALIKIHKGEEVPAIKRRKPRALETTPRLHPERDLRIDVIKELRKIGCRVSRVENSITGKNNTGLGDLWVFNERYKIAGWMELKSEKGTLTGRQPEVQRLCNVCGINYWIVRSVEEARKIIKENS